MVARKVAKPKPVATPKPPEAKPQWVAPHMIRRGDEFVVVWWAGAASFNDGPTALGLFTQLTCAHEWGPLNENGARLRERLCTKCGKKDEWDSSG